MKFGNLHFLWFLWLIPGLVVFYFWAFRRKTKLINEFVGEELRERLLQGVSFTRQKFKYAVIILCVVFAVISLIRPKWGFKWEEVNRRGVDIIVALDVSTSMLAEDVKPNRLERAKREIIDLLNILEGDRVGLLAFAGTSFLQSPLTLDYGAVQIFLDDLSTDLIPIPGTAIGDAIKKGVASFDQKDKKSRVMILITDGEDHQGKPVEQAKEAAKQQVKIYTIGIGKEGGAPIPDLKRGGFKKDRRGEMILTHLDEDSLQKIALETGGSYVRSVSGDLDLEKIYSDVRKTIEDKELKSGRRKRFEERFQWPLLIALILLIFESLYSEKRRRGRFSILRSKSWFGVFALFFMINAHAQFLTGFSSKGEDLYQDEKYSDALKQFTDDQINDPNDYNLKYNLANTYYKMKQYDKAEKLFQSAAIYGDKQLQQKSFYNLGGTAYQQGKLQEAVEHYKKALELDPEDEDAKHNLEFVREEIKRRIEENKKNQNKQCKNPQQQKQGQQKKDQENKVQDKEAQDKQLQNKEAQEKQLQEKEAEKKQDQQKQVQASKADKKKDDKKKMSEKEAMMLLDSLDDEQKKELKRKIKASGQYRVEKDW